MSDDAPRSISLPQIPWTTLAPIVTIVASLILGIWQPLNSPRPPTAGEFETDPAAGQNINARLWQDPLSVAQKRFDEESKLSDAGEGARQREIGNALHLPSGIGQGDKVLIMPVVMLQGSYGQDVEFRSRTRFAVMTGLWSCGYAPNDSDRIGAFHFKRDNAKADDVAAVAFEWCRLDTEPSTNLNKHLLVLWINETDFAVEPAACLENIVQQCRCVIAARSNLDIGVSQRAQVILAGSSTMLERLINEAATKAPAENGPGFAADIFACTTTADDAALVPAGEMNLPIGKINETYLLGSGITLQRTLATDEQMMDSIVDELRARHVLPEKSASRSGDKNAQRPAGDNIPDEARVVLISEYDTVYGRNLPLAFARAAIGEDARKYRSARDLVSAEVFPWLDIHTYARGFDGRLQGDEGANSSTSEKNSGKGKDSTPATTPPGEATEGLNQSDYLRRLALEIESEDRLLRSKNPSGGGVRAVGILGSDVYDKLMVLQALRTRLPETIFFTTDLDARLSQSKDWNATHNLVIAAPYGLSPDEDHTEHGKLGVAPFRDSYQTSVFKGVQRALGEPPESCATGPVRMFEIGRSGAVELITEDGSPPDTAFSRLAARPWLGVVWIALLACIAVIFSVILNGAPTGSVTVRCRQVWKLVWHHSWLWFMLSCIFSWLVTLALASWAARYGDAEPLAFADGVSIWPTVGFRILGILMGFHYLAKARRSLASNGRQITRKFFRTKFSLTEIGPHAEGTVWRRCAAWIRYHARIILTPDRELPSSTQDAHKPGTCPRQLWERYWRLTNRKVRRGRIGLMAVLYFIGGMFLFSWLGRPVPPVRGILAGNAELISLMLWVLVQIVLTFAVLDSLLQMTALIRKLNQGRSAWSKSSSLPKERDPALEHVSWCEVLDVRLIGARTKEVGSLFLYPFVVQAAGIAGRLPAIDNWSWPLSLIIVIGLNIFFVIVSMFILRLEAERARQQSLDRLSHRLVRQCRRGKDEKDEDRRRKAIESAIAFVRDTTEGAFAPATKQPAIRWVLWLASAFGAGGILQHYLDAW